MCYESESLTKDWINFVVLIRTAKKTKSVKEIINANTNGGTSISPKVTINKLDKSFIKFNNRLWLIVNLGIEKNKSYKIDTINAANANR